MLARAKAKAAKLAEQAEAMSKSAFEHSKVLAEQADRKTKEAYEQSKVLPLFKHPC